MIFPLGLLYLAYQEMTESLNIDQQPKKKILNKPAGWKHLLLLG
jgi:hypothetical protein